MDVAFDEVNSIPVLEIKSFYEHVYIKTDQMPEDSNYFLEIYDKNSALYTMLSSQVEFAEEHICFTLHQDFYEYMNLTNSSQLRLCLVNSMKTQRFFLEGGEVYRGRYLSDMEGGYCFYFSNGGLLSVKRRGNLRQNVMSTGCIYEDNYWIEQKHIHLNLPEEFRHGGYCDVLFLKLEKEKLISTDVVYPCIGRICGAGYRLKKMDIDLEEVCRIAVGKESDVCFAIQVEAGDRDCAKRLALKPASHELNEWSSFDLRENIEFRKTYLREDCIMISYVSNYGISFCITSPEKYYQLQFNHELKDLSTEDNVMRLAVQCRKISGNYTGLAAEDSGQKQYFFPLASMKEDLMHISIHADDFPVGIRPGYAKMYAVFEENGKKYFTDICCAKEYQRSRMKKLSVKKDDMMLCPVFGKAQEFLLNVITQAPDPIVEENVIGSVFEGLLLEEIPRREKTRGIVECIVKDFTDTSLTLRIITKETGLDKAVFVLKGGSNKSYLLKDMEEVPTGTGLFKICFDHELLRSIEPDATYRAALLAVKGEKIYYLQMRGWEKAHAKMNLKAMHDRRLFFYQSVGSIWWENREYVILPYFATNGQFSFSVTDIFEQYMGQFANGINSAVLQKGMLYLHADCYKLPRGKYLGFCLRYRNKIMEDEHMIRVPGQETAQSEELVEINAAVNISELNLKMIYWDIFSLLEINGKQYIVKCFCNNNYMKDRYSRLFCRDAHLYPDHTILYPYITRANQVALCHREYYPLYDTVGFRVKERAALTVYRLFKKYLDRKNIVLVYEKYCTAAQDNGYYFFLYCMQNQVENEIKGHVYYVIDKSSNDFGNVREYGKHVVKFASFRHLIYLLSAMLYVSTDTLEHSYVYRAKGSVMLPEVQKKKYVFLQHGVTAFKKVDGLYGKRNGGVAKFIVTSDFEKNIVTKNFDYASGEVAITGFARWDVLHDKSQNSRQILIVPTWRAWLDDVENERFVQSDYFKRYMELLNSERLYGLLKKYDVTCEFYLHIKFKEYLKNFSVEKSDRIRLIVFGERPLNELLMESRLLVTDYSSVSWDMFYQRKPIIFYQFDLDKYLHVHGSYIDMKESLIGDRAENLDSLLSYIEDYLQRDFELKPKYGNKVDDYFKYIDDKNSARIWKEVKKFSKKAVEEHNKEMNALVSAAAQGHVGFKVIVGMAREWLRFKLRFKGRQT